MNKRTKLLKLLEHYFPECKIKEKKGKVYYIETKDGSFSHRRKIVFPITIHYWINFKSFLKVMIKF